MNIPLLLKLADLLDTVTPEAFDYGSWRSGPTDSPLGRCGTTACALGYATLLPATGLYFECVEGEPDVVRHSSDRELLVLEAAALAFDVSHETAALLFIPGWRSDQYSNRPGYGSGPRDVAAWIRKVCSWEETNASKEPA